MGVSISDIVPREEIDMVQLSGWVVAIDTFNTLYQFLSTIRQPDGTPLMDSRGRITSHLSGLLYRTSSFIDAGIKPVFVFDGESPIEKAGTIESRKHLRERAEKEWKEALAEGDMEKAGRKARQSSRLSPEMVEEAKILLELMGAPFVQAPSEGEAQAAHMALKGDVKAIVSQDFDSLLFGAPRLIRNLAITGRRKRPRSDVYVTIKPEMIELEKVLAENGITRKQLVDLALMVGTDFNSGVKGIGAKTGLKLIKKYGTLEAVMEARDFVIPNYERMRQIFLEPDVIDDYNIKWKMPDEEGIKNLLCREHEFSEARVEKAVAKLAKHFSSTRQRSLDSWF